MERFSSRRNFIQKTGLAAAATLIFVKPSSLLAQEATEKEPEKEEAEGEVPVSTTEDLMREHGLLRRILLVYEESARRIESGARLASDAIVSSAKIVQTFVENYHEKLEEDYLFPRFQNAKQQVDLVEILLSQHQAGREVTQQILDLTESGNEKNGRRLVVLMREFARMYRPHAAREDTVLFPAFHHIVSAREFDELGEEFENKETQMFGKGGFEKMVDRVAEIEKGLAIYNLAKFTPKTNAIK